MPWSGGRRRASGRRDDLTLSIAQAVARGEAVVRVTPDILPADPTDLYNFTPVDPPIDEADEALQVALWLRQLQADFPSVCLELADQPFHEEGQQRLTAFNQQRIQAAREVMEEVARPSPGGQTLHQALEGYSLYIKLNYLAPGGEITPGGNKMLRECKILREHHDDIPLDLFRLDAIEAMITHWKHRPMTKRGKMCSPETSRDMIKRIRTFIRWLHQSQSFRGWRKPADLESRPVRIAVTPEEVSARLSAAQVETYTIDELCVLYEYASPWERLLLLLGVNCGFGVAEVGGLMTTEIHLRQPHGQYPRDGSWIKRVRFKSSVYGEWSLWPQTVAGVEWQQARRGKTEHQALLLTRRGLPLSKPTAGNNRNNKIPNAWNVLLQRVRKDRPDFRRLSFNKLRKTGADLVRRFSDIETASLFLCHGNPQRIDALLDLYTNRHFDKVFAALDRVHEYLAPMFLAVADPFPADHKKHNPTVSLAQVKRMRAMKAKGFKVYKIAEEVGVTDDTVRRYCKTDKQEA